jgi:arylsulfatase A-like enzyme
MDRRDFLKTGGAALASGLLADLGIFEQAASAAAKMDRRPNILFILVDEMRLPTVFPAGIKSREKYLKTYMPNLHELWRHGVKFESYYSSGNACSPARATIATGLYPHQEWLLGTRTLQGPALQTAFPTYGKLLRSFGYETPYIGKWHLSNPPKTRRLGYLERYGFKGFIVPDPVGKNGEGLEKDGTRIANTAVRWLQERAKKDAPFCLTVSFVNPHDKQYFWAGSEGDFYESLYAGQSLEPFEDQYTSVRLEDNPPPLGFPELPPNWETYTDLPAHGKPVTQQVFRDFQEMVWGGAPDDPSVTGFSVKPSPNAPTKYGTGVAPYSYWQRGLDMYTQVQRMVDRAIGKVVAAIPRSQLGNTVIVFASDHGEYAGAHGMLSGKIGSAYEEAIHIPMVVTDPSGRFTKDVDKPRRQLASSVDLLPMLVTLGNRGSIRWRTGKWEKIYGERLNLVKLLRNPNAAGRDHVLFSTDEVMPDVLNWAHAPTHVLAVRTREAKLVTYTHWVPGTTRPIPESMQLEFYDYATESGRAETQSLPDDPRAKAMAQKLFNQYVPQQVEAPLPPPLKRTVARARASYIEFEAESNGLTPQDIEAGRVQELLGYGTTF